jgi:hypothetical protein
VTTFCEKSRPDGSKGFVKDGKFIEYDTGIVSASSDGSAPWSWLVVSTGYGAVLGSVANRKLPKLLTGTEYRICDMCNYSVWCYCQSVCLKTQFTMWAKQARRERKYKNQKLFNLPLAWVALPLFCGWCLRSDTHHCVENTAGIPAPDPKSAVIYFAT